MRNISRPVIVQDDLHRVLEEDLMGCKHEYLKDIMPELHGEMIVEREITICDVEDNPGWPCGPECPGYEEVE